MTHVRVSSLKSLIFALVAALPVRSLAAPAAQVDFAVGNVTAVRSNGQSRTIAKGAQIEQGETIATNDGRAQLRFTDGAYVSLQPESEFRIDQYRFDGKQDGNEKGFFSLIKGGLRTITGLVGRNNKNNYQVTTSVATIGIRGTEYTIQYGQSVTGTVGEGEINVCNGAGCLSVTNGESYYVQNDAIKPVLTSKRTDLPPPDANSPPPSFVQAEDQLASPFILTGTQILDGITADLCDGLCDNPRTGVTVVFDSSGMLLSYDTTVPTSVQMAGNDGVMAWGTFMDTSNSVLINHFVTGAPVPGSDLSNLGGTTGVYSLIGSTPVNNSSNVVIGSLDSGSLTVAFGKSLSARADLSWTINGSPFSGSLTGSGSGSILFLSGNCGSTCFAGGPVALFGPNAIRAGMVYRISDSQSNIGGIGAAAFAKK